MGWLIIGLLGLGGAIAAGVAGSRKGAPAAVSAAMQDMMARYTVAGPKGERVFKPDVANAILRTLAGQVYHYLGAGSDPSRVRVSSDSAGVPPNPDISALGWARLQNRAMTIMAPVYMAEASPADRFLRAITPGNENWDGGTLYAVLAYGGAIATGNVPGSPPAPGTLPPPLVQPTPLGNATQQIPADLQALYQTLLQSGTDPNEMLFVASELDQVGMHDAAEQLRKRAADLRAIPAVTPGPTPFVGPGGAPFPGVPFPGGLPTPGPVPGPLPFPSLPGGLTIPGFPGGLPVPTPTPTPTPAATMSTVQKAAVNMNVALQSRGYKQADQGIYRSFQSAAGLGPDGFPGLGTMGKLAQVIATIPGVAMTTVRRYPWHTMPGITGYDGVNAPTWQEWTGQAPPMPAPVIPVPVPAPVAPVVPLPIPGMPAVVPAALDPTTATAIAMNQALSMHGYNIADQPLYKAFQASQGMTPDGFPGLGTMGKLQQVLAGAGVPFAGVPLYPWHSRPGMSGYDGVNAPTWAQWTAPVVPGVAA